MQQLHHPLFPIRTRLQRYVKPVYPISIPNILDPKPLLGSQGKTITLAHPDTQYKQIYGRLHRFHGLKHETKIRHFKAHSNTSTLLGYKVPRNRLKHKEQRRRRTGDGKRNTENPVATAESTGARAFTLVRLRRGMGTKETKGKTKTH